MNYKTLINLSNIRIGGAKQVAMSFLLELNEKDISKYNFLVSKEIFEELKLLNFRYLNYLKIYNSSIFKFFAFSMLPEVKNAKLIFTLFGPFYAFSRAKTITGFAQAWILFPNNLASIKLSFFNKLKYKLKFFIQFLFFKKDDILIVETEVGKKILVEKFNFKEVHVVNNSLNSVFLSNLPKIKELGKRFRIGVIGRNYRHKNLEILPQILDII